MSQVSSHASPDNRTPWHYKSTLDAARKMYKKEGIRSFYSGLGPALLGLTHVAIQFPLYEYLKKLFTGLEMGENHADDDVQYWGVAAATFLSKVCASSATYPHEILRTRLQTQQRSLPNASHDQVSFRGGASADGHLLARGPGKVSTDGLILGPRYRGILRTCQTILQEEGWRAFYNGMGTNMLRAIPAAMTTMLTYEFLQKTMHSLQTEGARILEEEGPYASS
jgi:solute carrier family 25 (mitochondrial folate transporter), member 32